MVGCHAIEIFLKNDDRVEFGWFHVKGIENFCYCVSYIFYFGWWCLVV